MSEILKYFQEKVIFLPVALPKDHGFDFEINFEEYVCDKPVEGKINVLHFKIKQPKGVIFYFHGNSNNLEHWGKIANEYTQFGYDVLVMDYRGYGKSSDPRHEDFLYSDAQFLYDFEKDHYGEEKTVVYGRSLGGAFANKVASDNLSKAVILEATFYNLQDIVNRWLPKKVTDKVSPTMTYHFLSNENIKKVKVPLYHFHGTKDFVIPIKSGKKLFEISGGNHDDLINYELFLDELKKY